MIPILLTATVNPQGMKGANFDVSERIEMYRDALKFYAEKGLKVVFAENSGFINLSQIAQSIKECFDYKNVEFVDVSGPE